MKKRFMTFICKTYYECSCGIVKVIGKTKDEGSGKVTFYIAGLEYEEKDIYKCPVCGNCIDFRNLP